MWRYVMEHFAFPGNIDFAADDQRIFHGLFMKGSCVYSPGLFIYKTTFTIGELRVISQMTQNNKYNKWLEILDFQPKLLWGTPTKIHREQRRRQQHEAPPKRQRTSFSTAKATSSTQRPKTCTESATKYYNYTTNGADEEREHRLPTLQKAMGGSGNAYSLQ